MPWIICGWCGASIRAVRTGRDRVQTTWDAEVSVRCEELKERLAAGEENIPLGECKAADEAIKRAIQSGRV